MSKPFQEMDPDATRKLLEGHEDVITPAVKKEQEQLAGTSCPKCFSGGVQARVDAKRPFRHGSVLPNKLMHCLACGTEFTTSGIILSVGQG